MRLSIIMPVLDEGERIATALDALVDLRVLGAEIVVVDGGSRDATIQRARLRADQVLKAPHGRAAQFNAGAEKASGDVLLLLTPDMQLPALADHLILDGLARSDRAWGHFDLTLEGKDLLLPIASRLISLQSRLAGTAVLEQGIFVRREIFRASGGFPEMPLLDDVEFSLRLKRVSRPLCIRQRVVAPARRWETNGVPKTLIETARLRVAYLFGADPGALARRQEAAGTNDAPPSDAPPSGAPPSGAPPSRA